MDDLLDSLKKSGLARNEARTYVELLKRGSISAGELAKKLSLDRTLTYQLVNNLVEKGFASYIIKNNKKYFEAANPDNLLKPIKEQEQTILQIIPQLKSLEKLKDNSQDIKIYEGKSGLKTYFNDIIQSKDIMIFGATGKSYDVLKFELPHLAKESLERGLKGRMITSKEYQNHQMSALKNLHTKYLEEAKGPATTTIYENTVAIHVLTDKPIVIIMKNKNIAESYKSYFEFLWKRAKK